jgi:hypothetical protein
MYVVDSEGRCHAFLTHCLVHFYCKLPLEYFSVCWSLNCELDKFNIAEAGTFFVFVEEFGFSGCKHVTISILYILIIQSSVHSLECPGFSLASCTFVP